MSRLGKTSTIIGCIALYLLAFYSFIIEKYLGYAEFITASFMLLITYFAILLLGYQKDKKGILKTRVNYIILSCVIVYFILAYLLGFFLGFLTNGYSLELHSIVDNIFSPIIIILASEVLRYVFICPNKDKKIGIIVLAILLASLELTLNAGVIKFLDFKTTFQTIAMYILPISLKHIVLTYLTYHCGFKASILYRLAMDLYCYVIPFIPDLGDYLNIVFNITLPFAIYIFASSEIRQYNKNQAEEVIKKEGKKRDFITVPVIIFIFCFAILISGIAPVTIVGVASGSMNPAINRGDGVLVTKAKEADLREQDIIVFQRKEKKIIHRIISKEEVDGSFVYHTKGDANNTADEGTVKYEDIIGKVNFKIRYIAYPSLYLNELINKE